MEDGFSWADKCGRRGWWLVLGKGWRWESNGWYLCNHGGDLGVAEGVEGGKFIMYFLGSIGEMAELFKLAGEGGEGCVITGFDGVFAFVEAVLEVGPEVG